MYLLNQSIRIHLTNVIQKENDKVCLRNKSFGLNHL